MTNFAKWIDIPADKDGFQGYLSLPKSGTGPAVVILQEIFGVNSHIREVADQYAADGYVAIAPDLFWRFRPHIELAYEGADLEKAFGLWQKIDVDEAVLDVGRTVNALKAMSCVTGKIAGVGYCFGGRLAYLGAAAQLFDASVAYYGGGIQDQLDVADNVATPIQFHYGSLDTHIPMSAVDAVAERFAGRQNAEVHRYPHAEHGFNCTHRASYHQPSAALAHGRALTFLAEHVA
ncbi:dienelactone hydrolase family protein [Burkholderia ubonensis]|uniref:dienelactone hydrolase family protein n=1 Tax=Burkholderia ubonensis TaxID=101571 RepID=UPI002AB20F7D|nr:dienelactone hydrolase family protein [Burkholderia ubonensis]